MSLNPTLLAAWAVSALLAAPTQAFAQAASAPSVAKPAAVAAPAPAATSSDGKIAWYGQRFAGRKTASGAVFNPAAMTMAHKTLPFGSRVKVTNTANQRSVVLRVNDRGPSTPDRVGDVSQAAARKLGMLRSGVANATLEVVSAK